jgi:hypothetical protein
LLALGNLCKDQYSEYDDYSFHCYYWGLVFS